MVKGPVPFVLLWTPAPQNRARGLCLTTVGVMVKAAKARGSQRPQPLIPVHEHVWIREGCKPCGPEGVWTLREPSCTLSLGIKECSKYPYKRVFPSIIHSRRSCGVSGADG